VLFVPRWITSIRSNNEATRLRRLIMLIFIDYKRS
jgi:hypothetical protein